jgi:DNA repair exonuclease SbcCD nuclease subunit
MKIAITADTHLTTRARNPERFHALENILDKIAAQGVGTLIIAGDLFDASCRTPGEFEEILKKKQGNTEIYIIPGNHDPILAEGTFSLPGIHYITRPQLVNFDNSLPFAFIPYISGSSVGEVLSSGFFPTNPGGWILVSHGDWLSGMKKNSYEKGTYMPLTGRDLQLYQPAKAFLGHIHSPTDTRIVHYPGSPCAMDPTETGYRTFIVFDTESMEHSRVEVETDLIYINDQITVLPLDDEEDFIRLRLDERIKAWQILPADQPKVRVRLKVKGYSRDRQALAFMIQKQLAGFTFESIDQPDLSQVGINNDITRGNIASLVKQHIDTMAYEPKEGEPERDDILLAALNTIYGGK